MTALLIAISFGLSNAAAHLQARQKKRAKRAILSSLTSRTVRKGAGARHAAFNGQSCLFAQMRSAATRFAGVSTAQTCIRAASSCRRDPKFGSTTMLTR